MDNIGVFDRSAPLTDGRILEQADGTAWMVLFCQNMVEISAELAMANPAYVNLHDKIPRSLPLNCLGHDSAGRGGRHVG